MVEGGAAPSAAVGSRAEAERRGHLLDAATGRPVLLVLRSGTLRLYAGVLPKARHRGLPDEIVQLTHGCEVSTAPDARLRIQKHVPSAAEYVFSAASDAEARQWCQALQASRAATLERLRLHAQFLAQGSTAYKYNYSNSKRMRRHFWVEEARAELCWGKTRTDEAPQSMDLKDCMGIIYGRKTSTFQHCTTIEDPPWCCFSLVFEQRTLDLAVSGDVVAQWFLGLQHVLQQRSQGCANELSEAQFVFQRVQQKLRGAAHRQAAAAGGRAPGPAPAAAAGRLAAAGDGPPGHHERRKSAEPRLSFTPLPREGAGALNGTAHVEGVVTAEEEEDLQKLVSSLEKQLEAATAKLETFEPTWQTLQAGRGQPLADVLAEALRSDSVSWQAEKCAELERELLALRVANGTTQRQLQAAERTDKQLKKLAKQFKESESQVQNVERELGLAKAGSEGADRDTQCSSEALERAKAQTVHLQRRLQDLEQQAEKVNNGGADLAVLQEQNKKQAEKLQSLQREKGGLAQQLEALTKEAQAAEARRRESERKVEAARGLSRKLGELLQRLQAVVAGLRVEQRKVKRDCTEKLGSITDSFLPLESRAQQLAAWRANHEQRYMELAQERKKLHNVVLELKGNIRLFVRVRPLNDKEKAAEVPGEATITFAEGCKVSVYEANNSRRKWFEFDKAFPPKCTQQEVFEEVKPLVTSVLDGYNACIFAYGQTGSGKTFTMMGTKENPGLNVRVLTELFRIRDERRLDTEIKISLMITEICKETIKDLFATKQKKLELKQDRDGSNTVPGLTEMQVNSVEAALQAMNEASANRAAMATEMDEDSSRAHSLVQVKALCKPRRDQREYAGKINLVDLAGSEYVSKSGVPDQVPKEAQNINQSLGALFNVIQALLAKSPHVPYGNSTLTMMLKDSLGGDAKTVMMVQSSPAQINVAETLSSLGAASRVRDVELGKAKRNTKPAE